MWVILLLKDAQLGRHHRLVGCLSAAAHAKPRAVQRFAKGRHPRHELIITARVCFMASLSPICQTNDEGPVAHEHAFEQRRLAAARDGEFLADAVQRIVGHGFAAG